MEEPKPMREIYEGVKDQGGFYGENWQATQGTKDENEECAHNVQRREVALAGGVDGGSGMLRDKD